MSDVTLILQQVLEGHRGASEELFPAVYEELRRLAAAKMTNERVDHTLSATALVHEAYMRLVDSAGIRGWDSRGHFFSAAAEAMRRILVDHARRKTALKRNCAHNESSSCNELSVLPADPDMIMDLDEAVCRLETTDGESAELLKLVLFAGLSVAEAGRLQGMSRDIAYRHWKYIRSWFAVHFDDTAI